jgi:hypothetical protein
MLTRDVRLRMLDEQQKKRCEVPLKAIRRVGSVVLEEWVEEERWFRENAREREKPPGARSSPAPRAGSLASNEPVRR